jgi:hypothetical protein
MTARVPDPGRERHTPRYAPAVTAFAGSQVARFLRDGVPVVLVAVTSEDTNSVRIAPTLLVVTRDELTRTEPTNAPRPMGQPLARQMVRAATGAWTIAVDAPTDSILLGVESLDTARRTLVRLRHGLAPLVAAGEPVAAISDLLFVVPGPATIADPAVAAANVRSGPTLETVRADAYGTTVFEVGTPLALYWELYGSHAAASVHYTLRIERTGARAGALDRLLGRAPERAAVEVRWTVPRLTGDATLRHRGASVGLSTAGLRPGTYCVTIVADGGNASTRRASRRLTVMSSGAGGTTRGPTPANCEP